MNRTTTAPVEVFSRQVQWAMTRAVRQRRLFSNTLLADLFSALRGPDFGSMFSSPGTPKYEFTVPLRCYIYGKTRMELGEYGSTSKGVPMPESIDEWKAMKKRAEAAVMESKHFQNHIVNAIDAVIVLQQAWENEHEMS